MVSALLHPAVQVRPGSGKFRERRQVSIFTRSASLLVPLHRGGAGTSTKIAGMSRVARGSQDFAIPQRGRAGAVRRDSGPPRRAGVPPVRGVVVVPPRERPGIPRRSHRTPVGRQLNSSRASVDGRGWPDDAAPGAAKPDPARRGRPASAGGSSGAARRPGNRRRGGCRRPPPPLGRRERARPGRRRGAVRPRWRRGRRAAASARAAGAGPSGRAPGDLGGPAAGEGGQRLVRAARSARSVAGTGARPAGTTATSAAGSSTSMSTAQSRGQRRQRVGAQVGPGPGGRGRDRAGGAVGPDGVDVQDGARPQFQQALRVRTRRRRRAERVVRVRRPPPTLAAAWPRPVAGPGLPPLRRASYRRPAAWG